MDGAIVHKVAELAESTLPVLCMRKAFGFVQLRTGRKVTCLPADVCPLTQELLAERAPDHVTYSGWEAIDAAEVAAGEPRGRPRVKFCFVEEMVEVAKSGAPA